MLVRYYTFENTKRPFATYDEEQVRPDMDLDLSYANVIACREDVEDHLLLEVIFAVLNRDDRPNAARFRSLSVGDVVTLSYKDPANPGLRQVRSYAVAVIGWKGLVEAITASADDVLDLLYDLEKIRPTPLLWGGGEEVSG